MHVNNLIIKQSINEKKGKMENAISKNWYMLLIKGIIMILLAVLIFMSPGDALLTYVLWIGIGFSIAGVARIVQGFQAKGVTEGWGWIVFEGVMDIILGFIMMAHPALTAAILPFMFGFWGVFYGFFLIIDAFSGTGSMGWKLIGGILTVIIGFSIMFNPVMMGMTLAVWVAIMLLVVGIFNVVASFSLK